MDKLNEVLANFGNIETYQQNRPNRQIGPPSKRFLGIIKPESFKYCSQMKEWQKDIYRGLKKGDVYVPAAPGAGKTLPYTCYWASEILGLKLSYGPNFNPFGANNPNTKTVDQQHIQKLLDACYRLIYKPYDIPKLLILVPIIQLAKQTLDEFIDHFNYIIVEYLRLLINQIITIRGIDYNNPTIVKIFNGIGGNNFKTLLTDRQAFYNRLQQSSDVQQMRFFENKIKSIDTAITNSINLYLSHITKTNAFISIKTGNAPFKNPKNTPVIISIYQSGPGIIDKFNKDLGLVVCDEAHKIQGSPVDNTQSQHEDIASALYYVLNKLNKKTKLCFLTGTINPTSAKLLSIYLKKCFDRNIDVININSNTAKNTSEISVSVDDSISRDNELIKIITSRNTYNNLIILFSKNKIDNLLDKALAKSPLRTDSDTRVRNDDHYSFGSIKPKGFGNVSSTPNVDYKGIAKKQTEFDKEIANIYDTRLRNYAYAGFGYLYRIRDDEPLHIKSKKANDNSIIATLFKNKKIHTLLATDAIGVGVNVDVQRLYLPTNEKFTGSKFEKLSTAELAQLLHRTGRGAFKVSSIITTSKAYIDVVNAVSMSPSGFTNVDIIKKISTNTMCNIKSFVRAIIGG